MKIRVEHTRDGDKLRREDGKLVGQLGKGKGNLPTTSSVSKVNDNTLVESAEKLSYAQQHEKLKLKQDFKKFKTIEELTSYIVEDMSWLPADQAPGDWIWGSAEALESQLRQWGREANGDLPYGFTPLASPDEAFRYEDNKPLAKDEETFLALQKMGYEHYLAQPLPLFVFGTLRPGQGNFRLIKEGNCIETVSEAKLSGVAMVAGKGYPYPHSKLMDEEGYSIFGDVVSLKPNKGSIETRSNMDRLESFRSNYRSTSLYTRVDKIATIVDSSGNAREVKVWIYVSNNLPKEANENILKDGNWLELLGDKFSPKKRLEDLKEESWKRKNKG